MAFTVNSRCTRCLACLSECPTGSIFMTSLKVVIDAETCGDHQACVAVCPEKAIEPLKPPVSADAKKGHKR